MGTEAVRGHQGAISHCGSQEDQCRCSGPAEVASPWTVRPLHRPLPVSPLGPKRGKMMFEVWLTLSPWGPARAGAGRLQPCVSDSLELAGQSSPPSL